MTLDGFFINLDRSTDRRRSIEAQLAALSCDSFVKRFPAVDGAALGPFDQPAKSGILACRLSHTRIIANSDPRSTTLILEDDVELSAQFGAVLESYVAGDLTRSDPDVDMLFLDCHPSPQSASMLLSFAERAMPARASMSAGRDERHRVKAVTPVSATDVYNACSTAYLVTPKGKQTLNRLLRETTDTSPIDIRYQHWIRSRAVRALIVVPFVATPSPVFRSTIDYEHSDFDAEFRLTRALRRLLFAGDPQIDMDEIVPLLDDIKLSTEYRLGHAIFENLWARHMGR